MDTSNIRKLRLFARALCKRYDINFILNVEKSKTSFDDRDEIKLQIKNGNDVQLYYCEIPVCPVTKEMVDKTIVELSNQFKFKYPTNDMQ